MADLSDLVLDDVLDGVDAVAHLAGEPGVTTSWGPAFARYVDRNIMATQRLLEAVSQVGSAAVRLRVQFVGLRHGSRCLASARRTQTEKPLRSEQVGRRGAGGCVFQLIRHT